MNTSSKYKSNFQAYDFMATNFSTKNGILETIAKLSHEEKVHLDEKRLQEWRKNLKRIRERSID
jgi:hypothetical protein